jgi:uncharacterized protein (DUF433 family)
MNAAEITMNVPLREDADGVLRVCGSRVPLDAILSGFEEGATAEEIALQYPTVSLGAIYAVIAYALTNPETIASYRDHRLAEAEHVRRRNESRFDPSGIRERLLRRRSGAPNG